MADTMAGLKRTHYATALSKNDIGKKITVAGWAQKTRDKGNLVFIDLRDRTGIIQLSFDETSNAVCVEKAKTVRAEFVIMASGIVKQRESINPDLATGEIEILVDDLRILSKSQTPPFHITDTSNVKEDLRLKYRYLDLRTPQMQSSMLIRHQIAKAARDYYDTQGFIEIETPMLIKSTPEGARDYLVPSRVHKGSYYALPQSPQLYKQLLMLSGFDKYIQIARCFRDEDLRADRQPEFTQIDLEMSFVDSEDVFEVNEGFMKFLFDRVLGIDLSAPFKRLDYKDAMEKYGSDKPDTRFELELVDLSQILSNCEFNVFSSALSSGGSIRAINAKGLAQSLSRKEIDKLVDFVKTYKAKGLAYTRLTQDSETSSYEKFLSQTEIDSIRNALDAKTNDVIFIVADSKNDVVFDSLGNLRVELAKRFNLIEPNTFDFLWVTNFPLFEYDEENNRFVAKHHPFTMVADEDLKYLEISPEKCRAKAYDLVLNGCEIGGGSIRINDPDIQQSMFNALGFSTEQANERFGFLIDAFKYGAPPHGGMAYGLDRLVMLMTGKDSIRDVIAFPKVQNASELMTMCPSTVDQKQLDEFKA